MVCSAGTKWNGGKNEQSKRWIMEVQEGGNKSENIMYHTT